MSEKNNTINQNKSTLNKVAPGKQVRIVAVSGGWVGHERLAALGFRPGIIVEMVAVHPFRGPVVVRLDNSQIALGRGLARKVVVEDIPDSNPAE